MADENIETLSEQNAELHRMITRLRRDLDEHRSSTNQLKAAREQALAANSAKSDFLACMSHELRTPLNAIIGFADGLLSRADRQPLSDFQKSRLTRIHEAGGHLLRLINDIFDIVKIEAGEIAMEVSTFAIGDLAREVAELVEGMPRDKSQVEFELTVRDGARELRSDRGKIKQVLFNLLTNAFKFTRSGRVTLAVDHEPDRVSFIVTDTGLGIPEHLLHRVFEKFHQIDSSTSRQQGGAGLGLTISQRLSDFLGGDLIVKSEINRGSRFTLTLPAHVDLRTISDRAKLIDDVRAASSLPNNSDHPLVLCIDDSPLTLRVMQHFLMTEGFGFLPALSGAEGLRQAEVHQPGVITLDVMMPGMNGWEVLKALKDNPKTQAIPVLLTTALDSLPTMGREAAGRLAKPVKRRELIEALNRAYTGAAA